MSLTDLMSGMKLSTYPQVALVIFLVVFAVIAWRVWRTPKTDADAWARMPMDDNERRNGA